MPFITNNAIQTILILTFFKLIMEFSNFKFILPITRSANFDMIFFCMEISEFYFYLVVANIRRLNFLCIIARRGLLI